MRCTRRALGAGSDINGRDGVQRPRVNAYPLGGTANSQLGG